MSLEPRYADLAPDLLARVTLADLGRAAAYALAPKPEVILDTSHVAPIRANVRDAIHELTDALRDGRPRSFTELCRGQDEKLEIVVRFLALLEMFKAGAVEVGQADRFGDITATWTGEGTDELAEIADDYSAPAEGIGGGG